MRSNWVLLFVSLFLFSSCFFNKKKREYTFNVMSPPSSVDPISFDFYVNHRIFRSIMATLVTSSARSDVVPYLAESWTRDDEDKIWTFKISDKFSFEDGTPITSQLIQESLLRMKRILEKRKSKNEVFDNLDKNGIVASGRNLILKFKRPIPNLLYHLSFGLFGVVSISDFDKDGNWRDSKKINSSGAYRISKWSSKGITVELKKDYPPIGASNKVSKVDFVWDSNLVTDLMVGNSDSDIEGYEFVGPVKSGFSYIHCYSWNDPNSILYSKQERKNLRDYIYTFFNKSDVELSHTLFPISPPSQMSYKHNAVIDFDQKWKKLKFSNSKFKNTKRSKVFEALIHKNEIYEVEVESEDFDLLLDPEVANKKADCRLSSSEIHLGSPFEDLKFMFLSKEGIALPDPSGRIRKSLREPFPDLSLIEKILWEDSIIFPISHHSIGFWHRTNLDFSQLNPVSPPIDFTWVGAKENSF